MNHPQIHSAHGLGLATVTPSGTVLDTWFPHPVPGLPRDATEAGTVRVSRRQVPHELAVLQGPEPARGVELVLVHTTVADLQTPPVDAHDVYLRLHLL